MSSNNYDDYVPTNYDDHHHQHQQWESKYSDYDSEIQHFPSQSSRPSKRSRGGYSEQPPLSPYSPPSCTNVSMMDHYENQNPFPDEDGNQPEMKYTTTQMVNGRDSSWNREKLSLFDMLLYRIDLDKSITQAAETLEALRSLREKVDIDLHDCKDMVVQSFQQYLHAHDLVDKEHTIFVASEISCSDKAIISLHRCQHRRKVHFYE